MHEIICMLIGRLLLLLVAAYELIWRLRQRLHALVFWSYDYWRSTAARERAERAVLERCRFECTKLPKHLVLVIAPNEAYVDAVLLTRLFGFALKVGIQHVSVYDRREQDKGYVDLAAVGEMQADGRFTWPPIKVPKKEENGYKLNGNGYTNGGTPHFEQLKLYQIKANDGHALIADVCRELYQQRKTEFVQNLLQDQRREAITEQISEMLGKRLGFVVPEPELGLIFARQTCTYGLLPWHVRFTEFHTHPSGRYFDVHSFTQLLYKYSRCEQRWGK
ncbi:uncharacterized protein Dwil_GK18421, isoform B [Drosophila willistoni]|uniref:ditrans,polycis-polyprenyl diphosphate synthase [(2E,6E)-farnesyldiphosphate specific] n=1 Tax=Drosophila willistoni TaxID=7260 RepID=B4NLL1_DROWI|nr:dehydrodolichyl diphosphate synthase complex subunit NUS1 [Drosophila willistoni]XP_015032087.1 dehydrodolichyl diphosphate synthase complex subunit NUS1 [Drosophila willistoni]EDW85250.1 uncharacterized protein Dwil_GK18421, isoform A [Drosophila willistoni]KRG00210.1 uncharacterized protein Dwil_GK18421, isoform B [Drosophila willistoni]